MSYVLESTTEFERLERQSQHPSFDFRRELEGLFIASEGVILDAGCGSGVVCRYLAQTYPRSNVVGCDLSKQRIAMAKDFAKSLLNLQFHEENITRTTFPDRSFDTILCRYVFQHLGEKHQRKVLGEFFRILKPGGMLHLVDTDGLLTTIYPQTALMSKTLKLLEASGPVDLFIGRKLPSLLLSEGFNNLTWKVDVTTCQGNSAREEIEMMKERLEQAKSLFSHLLKSKTRASEFIRDYTAAMESPGGVYFQNKFIVSSQKPKSPNLHIVSY